MNRRQIPAREEVSRGHSTGDACTAPKAARAIVDQNRRQDMTRFAATVLLLITVIPARSVGADLPGTDASDFACLGVTFFQARLNGAWRLLGLDCCTSAPVSDESYR